MLEIEGMVQTTQQWSSFLVLTCSAACLAHDWVSLWSTNGTQSPPHLPVRHLTIPLRPGLAVIRMVVMVFGGQLRVVVVAVVR